MTKLRLEKFYEQIFLNTILWENLTDKEFWTAFVVQKPTSDWKAKVLLFSNKHVFWGLADQDTPYITKKCRFALHFLNEDWTYDTWNSVEIPNGHLDRNSEWYKESEKEDVAAINISNIHTLPLRGWLPFTTWMRFLELPKFTNYDYTDIECWNEVVFVWYPSGIYDKKHTLPIMRKWTIASIPSVDFNGEKKILIDAQVFPWSSGSPVFTSNGTEMKLLGIMQSSLFIQKGQKPIDILAAMEKAKEWENVPMECFWIAKVIKKEAIQEVYNMF